MNIETAATQEEILSLLYEKQMVCPVCNKEVPNYMVRMSKLKMDSVDSDFRRRFKVIDPNRYEAFECIKCGYANLQLEVSKIDDRQKDLVRKKVTPEYKPPTYSIILSAEDALARFDQALVCAEAYNAKRSKMAFIHLKKAWVYRDMIARNNDEKQCLTQAYELLKEAFSFENFPLGNLDELTSQFLIGELARRLGMFEDASRWISNIILNREAPAPLKAKAQDMKELIREGKLD